MGGLGLFQNQGSCANVNPASVASAADVHVSPPANIPYNPSACGGTPHGGTVTDTESIPCPSGSGSQTQTSQKICVNGNFFDMGNTQTTGSCTNTCYSDCMRGGGRGQDFCSLNCNYIPPAAETNSSGDDSSNGHSNSVCGSGGGGCGGNNNNNGGGNNGG
jgi:hypothetical protein